MAPSESPPQVLALVTARGGSKRIPRKSIAPVAGRPLIAWTIDAARGARSVGRVVVSTDDPEMAAVSRQCGAEVPFLRPPELALADTPHIDVVVHAVDWLRSHEGFSPSHVLLLQPTSPLRLADDIDRTVAIALERDADAVVSVTDAHPHPCLAKRVKPEGSMEDFFPWPAGEQRRQALPEAFVLNGAIYLARFDLLLRERTWYSKRTYAYRMPAERSLDIDTPWDLALADQILRGKRGIEER